MDIKCPHCHGAITVSAYGGTEPGDGFAHIAESERGMFVRLKGADGGSGGVSPNSATGGAGGTGMSVSTVDVLMAGQGEDAARQH